MHPPPPLLLLRSSALPSAVPLRRRRRSPAPLRASWQELAGVLVFSAIPFTAVKALANSPLGARLRRRLENRKAAAAAEADALRAAARDARNNSFWYGGDRPRWLGPVPYDYPDHLTGEYPGDYGFDIAGLGRDPVAFANYFKEEHFPLGLSKDPVAFEELKVKEIKNGRLAMVAWLGFYIQAAVTGKGPVQNLVEHLSDPLHNNILSFIQ